MRTTITLDDELLRQAKAAAAASGRTLTQLVEDAVRQSLALRQGRQQGERVLLPVHDGGQLMPGVDLDDSAALLDLMEQADDVAP